MRNNKIMLRGVFAVVVLAVVAVVLSGCTGIDDTQLIAAFTVNNPANTFGVTFNASLSSDSNGSIISYEWHYGDGSTGIGKIVKHTYVESRIYYATLTVIDDTGKMASITNKVDLSSVNEKPIAMFTTRVMKKDYTIRFNGGKSTDSDGTITTWFWNFGDGTSGYSKVIKHTYAEAGTYRVILLVTDNDGAVGGIAKKVVVHDPVLPPAPPPPTPPAPPMPPTPPAPPTH